MHEATHPLVPLPTMGLSRLPIRRPRFTRTEAVILNELVNANGQPVTATALARLTHVMRTSVGAYICSIRAKLGEPAYQPQFILTDWPSDDNDHQLAWRFVG
jgi:hypothetical protein